MPVPPLGAVNDRDHSRVAAETVLLHEMALHALLDIWLARSERAFALLIGSQEEPVTPDLAKIDRTLDEALVRLGAVVTRLADPAVTRTVEEHRALAGSVRQFALCADRSADLRVHALRNELERRIKPALIWSR
jgi:hypothetical protein